MKTLKIIFILIFSGFLINCGGGGVNGGTETGTTDASAIGTKVDAVASALVPLMTLDSANPSSSADLLGFTYGTSDDWSVYLEETNLVVLTDIFGEVDPGEAPQTRVRVVLDQFKSTANAILSSDKNLSCSGSEALNEGDTIEIAFFGVIANGTSDNRHFDCLYEPEYGSGTETTIYGQDEDGTVRIVNMADHIYENTEETETRGNNTRNLSVIYAIFSEATEANDTAGYLDLQYTQATIYEGVDGVHITDDDVIFKSRTRITGRATLDASGDPQDGLGDFAVTKYDKGFNEAGGDPWIFTTKSIGRGSYGDGESSLLNIDSDAVPNEVQAGIYCIQHATDELPSHAGSDNCSAYETAVPWTGNTFPFTLSPEVEADFESKSFFEASDLISNTGDNFEIPTYETVSTEL